MRWLKVSRKICLFVPLLYRLIGYCLFVWEFEWGSAKPFTLLDIPKCDYPNGTKFIPLSWEEHCTECATPDCYDSCSLYSKRLDGACARFENGIQRVATKEGDFAHVVFKQWGKLESELPDRFLGKRLHSFLSSLNNIATRQVEVASSLRVARLLGWLVSRVRRRVLRNAGSRVPLDAPKFLHSIIFNSGSPKSIAIELSVLGIGVFRESISLNTGWTESIVELGERNTKERTLIRLIPNAEDKTELLFHTLNVVVTKTANRFEFSNLSKPTHEDFKFKSRLSPPVKCVVWDLDGTIWEGILMEKGDNPEMVLRDKIPEILDTLDARGILNSIASKNNGVEALAQLEKLGIAHFFVSPQINWNQKSHNLLRLASELNLSLSDFMFVDDSHFEIDEVRSVHSEVRTLDASRTSSMLEMPILNPAKSSLGSSRRIFYQQDTNRKVDQQKSQLNFKEFLLSCRMKLSIRGLNEQQDFDRGFELLNRSNQLNFSGLRLTCDEFRESVSDPNVLWVCAGLEDKYGTHGVVLVGKIVFVPQLKIMELAISCRVAGKYVEEAFFQWVIDSFSHEHGYLELGYVQTPRNGPIMDAINRSGFYFDRLTNSYRTALPKRILDSEFVSVESNL